MAHKKKHKAGRRRRRSVGALSMNPKSPLVMVAATAAGYFFGDEINAQIDKLLPATAATVPATPAATGFALDTPTLVMAGEIGIGAFLLLSKGKASLIKSGAGGLLAGAGLRRAAKKFGIVTGYQSVPVIGRRVAGYQHVPVIGHVPNQLTGIPNQLTGYRVNGYRPNGSRVMGKVSGLYDGYGVAGAGSGSGVMTSGSECMSN